MHQHPYVEERVLNLSKIKPVMDWHPYASTFKLLGKLLSLATLTVINIILTPIMRGEMYFQHRRKYKLGRWPIMFSISVQNFSVPEN